jgi:hypothetical protein
MYFKVSKVVTVLKQASSYEDEGGNGGVHISVTALYEVERSASCPSGFIQGEMGLGAHRSGRWWEQEPV